METIYANQKEFTGSDRSQNTVLCCAQNNLAIQLNVKRNWRGREDCNTNSIQTRELRHNGCILLLPQKQFVIRVRSLSVPGVKILVKL